MKEVATCPQSVTSPDRVLLENAENQSATGLGLWNRINRSDAAHQYTGLVSISVAPGAIFHNR